MSRTSCSVFQLEYDNDDDVGDDSDDSDDSDDGDRSDDDDDNDDERVMMAMTITMTIIVMMQSAFPQELKVLLIGLEVFLPIDCSIVHAISDLLVFKYFCMYCGALDTGSMLPYEQANLWTTRLSDPVPADYDTCTHGTTCSVPLALYF